IAEDSAKAKQQFLSNMSHEIRTPMNAIVGFTNVILKTELNDPQKQYLNAIKVSGDALIMLINDILDLAKVDSGKISFEQIPFDLYDSVASTVQLFEIKVQEKNLELITEFDESIPQILEGDPIRLRQIILNLLSNAVKFTNKGDIKLQILLVKEDVNSVLIEFTITDTGIGIPEDRLEHIFKNFEQVHQNSNNYYGGTGLGLAIVKQLVEVQGGIITVKSELDKGTEFNFSLWFKKTDIKMEHELEIEYKTKIENVKILVVEDMELNQLLIKIIVIDFGFEVDVADNGLIAIEKLRENKYDIILMDLQMPELDGFETTEYIRKEMNSQIPIIALTADVTTVDLEKCIAAGMDDYISKPIDEKLLYLKILKSLNKHE
ncbi:ATP-binding protein, partial [Emticicia sp.]|uniref:ATP-binding protein n=1 Tax=Emticicia sp. TaxID=1930953 RepID=UPI0037512D8A